MARAWLAEAKDIYIQQTFLENLLCAKHRAVRDLERP